MQKNRTYRNLVCKPNLVSFKVIVKETDLLVRAVKPLEDVTRNLILQYRGYIESYIALHPGFATALTPWLPPMPAPDIITDMIAAGKTAGVGPMAAVAGAIAEHVGKALLLYSDEVIVENGGDIFLKTNGVATVGIFAGKSPLSMKIGLQIDFGGDPFSVCTSSGTIGHSLSFGKADAVTVLSKSSSIADAAATAIGNRVKLPRDIQEAVEFGKTIEGVLGVVVILDDHIGMWGDINIVPLTTKND